MSAMNEYKVIQTYDTIIRAFKNLQYTYQRNDEEFFVFSSFKGNCMKIPLLVGVERSSHRVFLKSRLPFIVSYPNRETVAVALCVLNNRLANGYFDFDFTEGIINFMMFNPLKDSILGEELFEYMIKTALLTVDEYNSPIFKLSEATISIKDFISELTK